MRARTVRQHAVDQLERLVSRDVGGRGSGALLHPGDLWQSALALAQPTTRSVLITTGFPCCTTHTPPTETDGIGGSIAIARSLEAIGKRVSFVVDAANYAVLDASVRCGKAERYLAASDVLLYPATSECVLPFTTRSIVFFAVTTSPGETFFVPPLCCSVGALRSVSGRRATTVKRVPGPTCVVVLVRALSRRPRGVAMDADSS